jgi:hypothetical protein
MSFPFRKPLPVASSNGTRPRSRKPWRRVYVVYDERAGLPFKPKGKPA